MEASAQLDRVEAGLTAVVAALTRLDEGRYLHCSRCGAPLEPDTLAADPLADQCPDRCARTF
jgi:RNA polymerase-binding transcription factor DksA